MTPPARPTIYLDNASTSWPKPQRVAAEMARFLTEDAGSPGRAGHRMAVAAERVIREVRLKLARLIRADDPNRIALCLNGTDALNMAIKGVLREGDHVVCTVLDHNSVSRPLEALAAAGVITLTRLPIGDDGCVDPDAVRSAISPKTRLVSLIHASNVTGVIQPVAEIGRITREHETLLLVDAAQSIGVLDIDVNALFIDLLAFPGHKALLGPPGTGALYVGDRAKLRPWREGGTGADSVSPTQPTDYPTWLEAGTPNTVGLAGLNAALDDVNPARTLSHDRAMLSTLLEAIADTVGIHVVGGKGSNNRVGVLSLVIDGMSPIDAAAILDESFGIAVRPGLHCAPYTHRALGTFPHGTIRVSPGWATTAVDLEQLASALIEIAESSGGS